MRAPHRMLGAADDRGQSLVEFALVLPIFLLVITGLFDLARAVWQENTLAFAAREGTRYAIVHGSAGMPVAWTGSDATDTCSNASPNLSCQAVFDTVTGAAIGVANVSVTVTWPDTTAGTVCYDRNCRVTVDATAPFVPMPSEWLLGGAFRVTLRGGSQLYIQR
jgi:Flp pilus assembly protein TadG